MRDEASLERWLGSQIRPAPTAMVRTLPDGSSVILDLETERYVGLDAVGAEMWAALTDEEDVSAARDRLMSHFDVDAARLDGDLARFVHDLTSRGLVSAREAVGGDLDEPLGRESGEERR